MEFSELRLLERYSFESDSPLLVDVGAHRGGFSHSFAVRGWRLVAFEPERENHAALACNLAEFDQVVCVAKAVSDVTGEVVPFYVSEEHFGIHSLRPFHQTHRKACYEVETVRLDDALEEWDVSTVTLLKIDIEGADFLALRGFDFGRYRPELVMTEFMDSRSLPHFGYTHHDVAAYMEARGYATFVSEWEPIKEYGKAGVVGKPHVWVQCAPYPLDHESAWGNLIFVPESDTDKFEATLDAYLDEINKVALARKLASGIPGARTIHRVVRGLLRFLWV